MTVVQRSAFTPFSPAQMYALVNDVAAYPAFLPWCERAELLQHEPTRMRARLTVNKGRFRYTFTTENRLVPDRAIELELVEGPFRRFRGAWRFDAADGGCLVAFNVEFEFSSRVLGFAMGAAFKPIADSLVDAFKRRAYAVHGG
jgi:ribosome-associated toxin RatA of RatAB toxin-antitoxin module